MLVCLAAGMPASAVPYTSFNGVTYDLTAWSGEDIVYLTESSSLDAGVMNRIVTATDAAYGVYRSITGREPTPYPPTTLNGRGTIAQVPNGATCGAGCGYLGFTGIELASDYFNILYNGVAQNGQYDQVVFYELGRNFWFYGDELGALDPFVTGFAIANRFISMEEIGVEGGPFNGYLPFDEFKESATSDLLARYIDAGDLNWENTLGIGRAPDNPNNWDAPSLAGAFFYKLYEDNGLDLYGEFFRELSLLEAATDAEGAVVNFQTAAERAFGRSYRELFYPDAVATPEPGSLVLLGLGAFSIAFARRRRKAPS